MSETRTCANCGARSSPFIPRMRVGDELWCTPCASNNSFRRTTKANPQTQRMMQLIAAGWTGEDVIRHELGRQKVHNIYVNGDHAGAMCPEHLRMHRSRSDFASGLAAQVGLNHRYPTIQTSPEHEGRCDECSQVQSTQNPALPWEHRRNPGSLPPHEDRQPTPHHEGDDEGEGYQRGRWPYRPLSPNRTERHTPVVPAIQSLNMRIAVPVPQEGRPFPGIRVQAHDSGDGETIFHCPMCGSGQVIARSDGTVECEFCQTAFTVQIQPQMPAFPQTIDGVPVDVPGMPAGGANANVPSGDPMGDPEEEPPEDAEDESDMPAFLKGSLLLRTIHGDVLDSPQYLRHLALTHANDSNAVLAQIRDENGRG